MPTQQLQQPSPIPEGFNIAAAVMDRAVWFHLANGGPASAREHIKTLRDELSYLYQTDCTPAYTAAMAKIVAAEEAERLEAEQRHMEQQSQLMLAMLKAMQTSQQPPRPAETQPPSGQQETDLSDQHIQWCLERLMDEKLQSGEPLFNQRSHWQAVFRILADKKLYTDSDFDYFDNLMMRVMPLQVNSPYTRASVKIISQTEFNVPFERWVYRPEFSKTRKPFERMYKIAHRFKQLLEGQE